MYMSCMHSRLHVCVQLDMIYCTVPHVLHTCTVVNLHVHVHHKYIYYTLLYICIIIINYVIMYIFNAVHVCTSCLVLLVLLWSQLLVPYPPVLLSMLQVVLDCLALPTLMISQ